MGEVEINILQGSAVTQTMLGGLTIYPPVANFLWCTGWSKKNRTYLNVDNFAMVSGRKACGMSKVCKFCLEKSPKLA